jgi:hypothetical protein
MALVTSNAQGELDPLEIGIHAFEAVPISKGGKGKKGGVSEYAEKIGFFMDLKCFFGTIISVIRSSGVVEGRISTKKKDDE